MRIRDFFASLLPSFSRSYILEDIDSLRKDLSDNVIPAFKSAYMLTRGKDFKCKLLQDFDGVYVLTLPQYRKLGFIGGTLDLLNEFPKKLDLLEAKVVELFAKDVTRDTMTYRKAAILQYLETCRFVIRYASRSLLRFITAETNMMNGQAAEVDKQLSPAELKWLLDNQSNYLQAAKLLAHPAKDLGAVLEEIPNIAIDPNRMDIVSQTVGKDRLDPFRFNLIAANWNPIYHYRLRQAEWQVKQYQASLEEKRVLELRLLSMKEAYNGKQDAKLAKAIEYNEGRLQKLNFDIARIEDNYAHA